jgi:ribosome-binding protein aMBF1 (putative translation factor)
VTAKKTKRKPVKANGSSPRKHSKSNGVSEPVANRTGRIIRRHRESKPNPLTREDLAMRMGCCMSTIRNWEDEKGTREPRISQIRKLEEIKPGLIVKLFHQELRSAVS